MPKAIPVNPSSANPKLNHLLAALPSADYERILPGLEPVTLPLGEVLY